MGSMKPRMVCGWYTPDYADYAERLAVNLRSLSELYDLKPVEKIAGGWERNTLRKPAMMLEAIDRHPDRVVVFLDVDCEVLEPLAALSDMRGDVSMHLRAKYAGDGTPRLTARSGTMVLKRTSATMAFLATWASMSASAPRGSVDQRTLPMALAATPGLTVENLDVRYCAVACDGITAPAILHDSASRSVAKVPGWLRRIYHLRGH